MIKYICNGIKRPRGEEMGAQREIKIYICSESYEVDASLFSSDDVRIEFVGTDSESEKMEIKTLGKFCINDGRAEISYDESEITGMKGSVTSVSYGVTAPEVVTMLRTGEVSAALVFEKGRRHHCVYSTPYMPFEVCVKTFDVKNRLAESGELELDYVVEIRGAAAERNKFYMKIMD